MRGRTAALATLALATACSGGSTHLAGPSPSPTASATASPTPTVTSPLPKLSPTPSPTPRRASSARRGTTRSPTPSPTPRPTHSPSPKPSPTPAGTTYGISEVTVVSPRFSPSVLTLHRGDSVLVTNKDSTDHTFTIASMGKDSGDMGPGATYRLRFPNAGTFNFVCTYHESSGMTGTVKVTA